MLFLFCYCEIVDDYVETHDSKLKKRQQKSIVRIIRGSFRFQATRDYKKKSRAENTVLVTNDNHILDGASRQPNNEGEKV